MKAKINNKTIIDPDKESPWNHRVALIIILSSMLLIAGIVAGVFSLSSDKDAASQTLLTAVLPLIGAWVGAVIAFYFSGKNLEKATNSVQKLLGLTSQQKLQSIPVKDKMITRDKMFFEKWTVDKKILLVDVIEHLRAANKGERIPVLNDKFHPICMIHRSEIDKYLLNKVREVKDIQLLTLEDMINEKPEFKTYFETVGEKATLADAKKAMEQSKYCQDVFVTLNGTREEEVLGWITNVIIEENSEV